MALTSSEGVDKYISRKPLHHFFQEIFTHWVGLNALFNITFMSSFVQDYYSTVQGCQMKISIKSQIVLKKPEKSNRLCKGQKKKTLFVVLPLFRHKETFKLQECHKKFSSKLD